MTGAMMIGVFSKTAAKYCGTIFWRHVDGRDVEVTAVMADPEAYFWPDKVIVGPVTTCLRQGQKGTSDFL